MENNMQLSFGTVTESLEWLKSQGYTHDFNVEHECLETCEIERSFSPDDFFIDLFSGLRQILTPARKILFMAYHRIKIM